MQHSRHPMDHFRRFQIGQMDVHHHIPSGILERREHLRDGGVVTQRQRVVGVVAVRVDLLSDGPNEEDVLEGRIQQQGRQQIRGNLGAPLHVIQEEDERSLRCRNGLDELQERVLKTIPCVARYVIIDAECHAAGCCTPVADGGGSVRIGAAGRNGSDTASFIAIAVVNEHGKGRDHRRDGFGVSAQRGMDGGSQSLDFVLGLRSDLGGEVLECLHDGRERIAGARVLIVLALNEVEGRRRGGGVCGCGGCF
mmetsp:Transcript_2922/g.8196  ORF Transcript_2922/g.8196 Transcript_2922/m.8196 type:complete len:252 (-) Transcript_2922:590-1345(-)